MDGRVTRAPTTVANTVPASEPSPAGRPSGDLRLLLAVQRRSSDPSALATAAAFNRAGEHGAAWIGLGLAGAVCDPARRPAWLEATTVVVTAHAASVVTKRVVRRQRPQHASLTQHVAVPSRWSFPSSHMTSTTAAALVYGRLLDSRATLLLPIGMGWSRLALGVHYLSDVLSGAALGAAVVATSARARRQR